jgi:hypothetical protein
LLLVLCFSGLESSWSPRGQPQAGWPYWTKFRLSGDFYCMHFLNAKIAQIFGILFHEICYVVFFFTKTGKNKILVNLIQTHLVILSICLVVWILVDLLFGPPICRSQLPLPRSSATREHLHKFDSAKSWHFGNCFRQT